MASHLWRGCPRPPLTTRPTTRSIGDCADIPAAGGDAARGARPFGQAWDEAGMYSTRARTVRRRLCQSWTKRLARVMAIRGATLATNEEMIQTLSTDLADEGNQSQTPSRHPSHRIAIRGTVNDESSLGDRMAERTIIRPRLNAH